ncbi:EAL domain-containing protein [Neorhizobium sp. P12A]|jgi:diguanylate cyclase (GGDEF)-like protein|uniref:putative bifunctional diguanylate cyclase/phosphodiesterase n=1 Tax=Rhizobium/Agrobacterium group TaxID=227290 RepID=UPI0010534711|nr:MULTISPECIES: EAL domain-containing protein [Rhizobium/Agrobacterium group]KAA0701037.1 EAL domain-containing protein [Neorhizobium sp. P12A]TCR78324.1 diguanylate cyclase/phosphodiesterase [Rhizobium sp. BK376]
MKPQSPNAVPTDVYLSFVSSLFGNRNTLFTGMTVQVLTYLVVYAKSGANFYLYLSALFVAVCIFRVYWFQRFDATDKSKLTREDIARWERLYLYGGVSTTTLLGIGSGYAILVLQDFFAEIACIAVTLASMVSVVGRNYGSPKAVNLQTISASLPISLGFLLLRDPYMVILSLTLIPFVLTTRSMANGVREFLYKNVIASREISLIADRFDTALNNMTHGLFMLDADNRILVVNRKACELLHLTNQDQLKDCELDVVLRYGVRNAFIDGSLPSLIQRQLAQLVDGSLSRTLIQFNEDLFLEFSASRRDDGVVILIFEDVTGRIRAERKIMHMVRFDPLTGLPNREYFVDLVKENLSARRRPGKIGIMVIDVDDFKHVNDMKGHVVGDRVLVKIAGRLKEEAGSTALVARLVGDQFVLFFPNEDDAADLDGRIRSLHAAMAGAYEVDDNTFRVSFSSGYVTIDSREFRPEEWQIKADLALFEAKSRMKGGCSAFEQEMDARYLDRQKLKDDLRLAIETGKLHAVYQPMFTPDGTKIDCCEALVRWVHPEKGSIPPNVFVQIAEEMGIVAGITKYMINQACRDCASWPAPLSVSVNLSAQDLRNTDIIAVVADALATSGLTASRLHIEVTESCLVDEFSTVRAILSDLRSRGITIAIDDFGTGFSSLSYLDSLPIDIVKIDRSFVNDIVEDTRRFKLLRGIVNLSRELSLEIVVEGVETRDQLMLINKHQCADYIQGYVFSTPVSTESILEMVDGLAKKQSAKQSVRSGKNVA